MYLTSKKIAIHLSTCEDFLGRYFSSDDIPCEKSTANHHLQNKSRFDNGLLLPTAPTEGAYFQQHSDYFTNERSITVSDIPSNISRSLSDDFQDSFDFFSAVHEIMSYPGGTNSLPAFLSGRSGERTTHSALLQQAQSNRAVENDYCENPLPQRIQSGNRGHSRNTRAAAGSKDRHYRRHHHHRDSNGVRQHTRSSNRRQCNREGAQAGFHRTVSTSASSHTSLRGDQNFDTPPLRPPLSKYHIEHRNASRALRASSSLPASLTVKSGDELLVPMRNNPVPSYQQRFGRNERHRAEGSSTRAHVESLHGYSLTPPPVCRANKPRYDSNNRIIQTVSSPSVVTQCVDSWRSQNQWPVVPSSGKSHAKAERRSSEEKSNLALSQPTHVVISQQPKSRSKNKLIDDDDDEIARQKKGLVVNINNNIARTTQPSSEGKLRKKKKSKSAKSSESKDNKKHEFEKLVPTDASVNNGADIHQLSSTEITPLKSGERCPRCGKCSESDRDDKKTERSENPPDSRCSSAVDTCVETTTCVCCVKGLFYHCLSHEDEETFAEKPCSCRSERCCLRWSIMGILSFCLPCLCCYPLARGGVKLCRGGRRCMKSDCQCNEPYS